jgi:hypothetical protein
MAPVYCEPSKDGAARLFGEIVMRVFNRDDLIWRSDGGGLAICFQRRVMLRILPDATWPKMWRVQHPDGRLSDMVNLTRAKDAAITLALASLNTQDSPAEAPPMRPNGWAGTYPAA